MNAFDYVVVSIEGDYANLKRTDVESDELKLVARALLPDAIREGTRLHYQWMEYSIVE
ncbi:MAG: chorismate--pyruvate lyase [Kineothrix sp.]